MTGSTIGGVVATGLSGPGRYLHGAVRDLVLGATIVRADGVVVHAGSKVVKNVAGYDLAKLFTGSYGTLGVLTELTVKLKPIPITQRFVVTSYAAPADLGAALSALLASQSAPTAIEIDRPRPSGPIELSVLIEGRPGPVEKRSKGVADILSSSDVRQVAPPGWGRSARPADPEAHVGAFGNPCAGFTSQLRGRRPGIGRPDRRLGRLGGALYGPPRPAAGPGPAPFAGRSEALLRHGRRPLHRAAGARHCQVSG